MITKGKTTALTGLPIDEALFKSEHEIKDQAILDLLAVIIMLFSYQWTNLNKRRRRKSSKKSRLDLYLNYLTTISFSLDYYYNIDALKISSMMQRQIQIFIVPLIFIIRLMVSTKTRIVVISGELELIVM